VCLIFHFLSNPHHNHCNIFKKGFKVTVADLEDFSPDEFNDSLRVAIMVMATYGEGEPTDNASAFIKWCKVTTTYTHIEYSSLPDAFFACPFYFSVHHFKLIFIVNKINQLINQSINQFIGIWFRGTAPEEPQVHCVWTG